MADETPTEKIHHLHRGGHPPPKHMADETADETIHDLHRLHRGGEAAEANGDKTDFGAKCSQEVYRHESVQGAKRDQGCVDNSNELPEAQGDDRFFIPTIGYT